MLFNFKKKALDETLDIFNFVFTFIFLIEAIAVVVGPMIGLTNAAADSEKRFIIL